MVLGHAAHRLHVELASQGAPIFWQANALSAFVPAADSATTNRRVAEVQVAVMTRAHLYLRDLMVTLHVIYDNTSSCLKEDLLK